MARSRARVLFGRLVLAALVLLFALGVWVSLMLKGAIATVGSLQVLDDHPLVTMDWEGGYGWLPTDYDRMLAAYRLIGGETDSPACTLFAAHEGGTAGLFGRNFDWHHSPALVLRTDPPGAYASISIVDLTYLGFGPDDFDGPLTGDQRLRLLIAPLLPFDGMNEHGLAVGMAKVPRSEPPYDENKPSVHHLAAMRLALDGARTAGEAVALWRAHNLKFEPGPHVHFLVADAEGRSAVVEWVEGEMVVIWNEGPWHAATNFCMSRAMKPDQGRDRYLTVGATLGGGGGSLSVDEAMALLERVQLSHTQWSAVYDLGAGELTLSVGKDYDRLHHFAMP